MSTVLQVIVGVATITVPLAIMFWAGFSGDDSPMWRRLAWGTASAGLFIAWVGLLLAGYTLEVLIVTALGAAAALGYSMAGWGSTPDPPQFPTQ